MSASFAGIMLTNSVWLNEFDGSGTENNRKHTEDGRLFLFQRKKQKYKIISLSDWSSYRDIKALQLLRDTGSPEVLTLDDGRQFNAILETIDGVPVQDFSQHNDDDWFTVTLNFIEI